MRRGYGARRRMMGRMMMHGGCCGSFEEPAVEDKIEMLEEYQRNLEEETADVAERIRRLREEPAEDKETVGI